MNLQIFHDFAAFSDILIDTRPKGRVDSQSITE